MKLKFNKVTILLSAIATIILLGIIVNQAQLFSSQKVQIDDDFAFDKISVDNVEKIEIIKAENTIVLEKIDGTWKVGEKDANAETINSLISLINKAEADKLVSTNSANHARFGIDNANARILKFYKSGSNLIEQVMFGNYVNGGKIYGRKADGNNVYTINANIYGIVSQPASNWEKAVEDTTTVTQ